MTLPISSIRTVAAIVAPERVSAAGPAQPGVFQALLNQSVQSVEQTGSNAQTNIDRFLSGEGEELHHVALAAQGAELSFDLFMQVRNKVVQAYQDIMRMQI